jgi:hypothetical protein
MVNKKEIIKMESNLTRSLGNSKLLRPLLCEGGLTD